ncbi:hypothetical protein DFH09DRAFT_811799, partial [Mycena vulgaris]
DHKTMFWDSYKTVADEYDEELRQRYSTDLDTALIFAGLFSVVSSAFIIQIQPELKQDPDEMTQALLRLLIHNFNGSIFSGDDISIPTGPNVARNIVLTEVLLYTSLFSTLLVALLTVLGKRWLLHFAAAGEKGTIEERGIRRQRKLDGLRRWGLEPIMQMFPLLLQIALLLFASALYIYLGTVHTSLAHVALVSLSLGSGLYFLFAVSATIFPDCPFQTP